MHRHMDADVFFFLVLSNFSEEAFVMGALFFSE